MNHLYPYFGVIDIPAIAVPPSYFQILLWNLTLNGLTQYWDNFYTSQTRVRFVLEKLRNEGIPGSNRVIFGLSSHLKAPVRRQLNSHVGERLLKSHTVDAAVKALPLR
ncbi:MAG: hypothetical protein V7L00_02790 [Nostoc sp.]|uniref:hypothetical protein n=1 Tax=Nostoc sp. TaxID=1180 RepID=UPI002FFC40B7